MTDELQRESIRHSLLDQPGAAIPGWVDGWMEILDADAAARQERLFADIQTLIENDVEGVEDMRPMEVFVAILKLEREGIIARED